MLAERGEPNVERLLFGGELEMPLEDKRVVPVINPDRLLIAWQQIDCAAFTAWAMKDSIVAALDKAIVEEAGDVPGLTDEARANRIAEINRDLLTVAREETALVEHGAQPGHDVDRAPRGRQSAGAPEFGIAAMMIEYQRARFPGATGLSGAACEVRPPRHPPSRLASHATIGIADVLQTRARGRRQRFTARLAQGEAAVFPGRTPSLRLGSRTAWRGVA